MYRHFPQKRTHTKTLRAATYVLGDDNYFCLDYSLTGLSAAFFVLREGCLAPSQGLKPPVDSIIRRI